MKESLERAVAISQLLTLSVLPGSALAAETRAALVPQISIADPGECEQQIPDLSQKPAATLDEIGETVIFEGRKYTFLKKEGDKFWIQQEGEEGEGEVDPFWIKIGGGFLKLPDGNFGATNGGYVIVFENGRIVFYSPRAQK